MTARCRIVRAHRAVAARRPLCREDGAAARAAVASSALMHRRVQVEVEWFIALSDAGLAEFKPLSEAARGLLRGLVDALLRRRRARDQGHRAHHQPRRQGGRVLAEVALRRPCRAGRRRRVRALRLHQRGHQQHQPRADAEAARATTCCCRRSTASSPTLARDGDRSSPTCRCSAARTARPPSPTTVGKEIANVVARLAAARSSASPP